MKTIKITAAERLTLLRALVLLKADAHVRYAEGTLAANGIRVELAVADFANVAALEAALAKEEK